ncbi:MAG: TonB-dependent receptor [Rikenellaceae bacterium]
MEKELLDRLSVHSVADAIRYFSGVQIKDYGGIGGLKTVNIRSMGTQHVGVFYDGVELGNAQNGTIDLGRFSLDNMEAITMYNGQKSAIFQPAKDFASAGSIYMQSRIPSFDDDKNYNAKATFKTGSFDLINPSILYEHKLTENLSAALSAEYMYTSGEYKFTYEKADGYTITDTRENGDVTALRVEGGLFGKIQNGEWKTKIYYYDSERGYPGASVREEPGVFQNEDRQWDNNFFAQGSLRKSISSKYSILLSAKYAYDYLHYLSDPSLDVSTMYVNNHYTQQEGYLSLANYLNINHWWSANLSVDYLYNTLDADLYNFVYPKRSTLLGALASSATFKKLKVQASLLYTFVGEQTSTSDSASEDNMEWTPTVVMSYSPFDNIGLDFRAFYKRIFRMPTLNDLYYTFIGNIDLEPEYTNQYNVGVGYNKSYSGGLFRNINIQLDAYYNEVENKIIAMPTSNQFRWTMINLGQCEIRGLDLAAQTSWQISEVELNTRLNYTYQKAQDFTYPSSEFYGGQIPYIPWHSGSVVVGGTFKSWELNYSFIYTGERYESQANIIENYAQPWYTHDISLSKTFLFKNTRLRATAEVNNLLNQQYEVVQCYPMPGTNVKVIVTVDL